MIDAQGRDKPPAAEVGTEASRGSTEAQGARAKRTEACTAGVDALAADRLWHPVTGGGDGGSHEAGPHVSTVIPGCRHLGEPT